MDPDPTEEPPQRARDGRSAPSAVPPAPTATPAAQPLHLPSARRRRAASVKPATPHILEKAIDLDLPLEDGMQLLLAQIPNRLARDGRLFRLADPAGQQQLIRSVLAVAREQLRSQPLHLVLLPESSVPAAFVPELIGTIENGFPENVVVIFGIEHQSFSDYLELLQRRAADNLDVLEFTREDAVREDFAKPVNCYGVVVKEQTGKVRCFFSAKTHPFAGEESVDHVRDLYQGNTLLLFRCLPVAFNFMPLICFDYVHRDLHRSNVMEIIERANQLYFQQRQQLDLIAVIQCNPKPDHKVFRDVVTGFYGQHLFMTPGTRECATVFVNTSAQTQLGELTCEAPAFGHSSFVFGERHQLPAINVTEFCTDSFDGAPVSRLRFGADTRLFVARLFPYHETDPRLSRSVVKVSGVYRPSGINGWERIASDDLVLGISGG